jgi:hypothetical protein
MATYLQGVTDYIPQIQPWTPDYNLYAKVLGFKQSRQDAAVKQLSTLYGSLLNAPLTRDDTAETRDKVFKTIEQDIKKMATLDLSKRQNVEAARGVFNQLLDNDIVVYDMMYTKHWMSEFQKGQSLKGCTDPEKCQGQWWPGGDQYMNFKRMEFKNATAEDAMKMGKVNYVSQQDITRKAIDLAKELEIEIEAGPQFANGFIITGATNDLEEAKLYNQIFTGLIGNDPLVKEYYKAKAYNKRMGWAYQNEQQYGSVDAANTEYINQSYSVLENLQKQADETEDKVNVTQKKIDKLNKDAGEDIPARRSTYVDMYKDLVNQREAYNSTYQTLDQAKNQGEAALNYAGTPKVSASYMDEILALGELQKDILGAAQQMAMKQVKAGDIKVNQYALERKKQQYRKDFEEIQFKNRILLAQAKGELVNSNGNPSSNTPEQVITPGSTSVGDTDTDSYDYMTRVYKQYEKDAASARNDLSQNEAYLFNQMLTAAKAEGDLGDQQAKEDYINLFNAYYNGLYMQDSDAYMTGGVEDGDILPTNTGQAVNYADYDKVIRAMNNATTLDEKYRIAKSVNVDLEKISGEGLDYIYDNKITKFLNPKDKMSKLRSHIYEPILSRDPDAIGRIKYKNLVFEQWEDMYKEQANQVIADSRTGVYKKMSPIFEALIDPSTGDPRSEADFVNALKNVRRNVKDADLREELNNLTTEDMKELYNGTYEDIEDFVNLSFEELDLTEDVQLRDIWKSAYTEYIKPQGNKALVPGAGDEYAAGNKYSNVDPDGVNSNAMKGAVSFMKDGLSSDLAIVDIREFSETLPDLTEATINNNKAMLQQIYNGMVYYKGKDYRPYFDVTYTNIAGGNSNYAGINIKVTNPAFYDKFKGVKDDRGPLYVNRERLMSEGITVYLPKSEAGSYNFFVQNSKRNDVHKLLDWQGHLDLDVYAYNPYVKDMKVKRNSNGTYSVDGAYRVGINDKGREEFDSFINKKTYPANVQLQDMLSDINDIVMRITEYGKEQDAKIKSNR